MSKKQFKSQASSSRAVSGAFGAPDKAFGGGILGGSSAFGAVASSPLSYVYEPPDLGGISVPNIVVALKNLQKKDATTKAKALEDLQTYVLSLGAEKGGVENAILEAWIKLYPRTSIDSARRVRQLAHLLQGQLSISCGKRIAKYMPRIVGSWLAGLYDNDKSVTRAAQESLIQVFTSEEKMKNVWTIYQNSVLEYSKDIITKETVDTLSDERTASPDDAAAKYIRVIGTAIMMVTHIIDENSSAILEKKKPLLRDFLSQEKVWSFASHTDPFVRRSVYRLLAAALAKERDTLSMSIISSHVLTSSLHISQAGSAYDYAKVLAHLTIIYPDIWTQHYSGSGKNSATKRLCQFLRKGSQGGPAEYWDEIVTLLRHVPDPVFLPSINDGPKKSSENDNELGLMVIEALHDGLINRDEPRGNQSAGWSAYLSVCEHVVSSLGLDESPNFLRRSVFPVIVQFINPSQGQARWTVPGTQQLAICVRALRQMAEGAYNVLQDEWRLISMTMVVDLQVSLPEQSKDHVKSQTSISAKARRWYGLQASVLEIDPSNAIESLFYSSLSTELNAAIQTLRARNGKPYGAAAALEIAIRLIPKLIFGHNVTKTVVTKFALDEIPNLLLSPSAPHCIAILNLLEGVQDISPVYQAAVQLLLKAPESAAKNTALQSLISSPVLAQSAEANSLAAAIRQSLARAMGGIPQEWTMVEAAMSNPVAPLELIDELLATMTNGLSIEETELKSLGGLELSIKCNAGAVKAFSLTSGGSDLLSKLLFLSDSPNENVAHKARNVSLTVEAIMSDDEGAGQATRSMIEVIQKGINVARTDSLSIESLNGHARRLLEQASENDKASIASKLLPNAEQFAATLNPFLAFMPNPSLAIMNSLGGAIYLIDQPSAPTNASHVENTRDIDGHSAAVRAAWYTTKIIRATDILSYVAIERQVVVWRHLSQFLQLASDNISVPGCNDLWRHQDPDLEIEILDFIAEAQGLLASWLLKNCQESSSIITTIRNELLEESHGFTVQSYYSGRAYALVTAEITERHGHASVDEEVEQLRTIRRSPNVFTAAAFLASASESKALLRLCNELVADLTGHNFHKKTKEGLRQLVIFNCILQRQEDFMTEIPQQRLIFFVKHVVTQLQDDTVSTQTRTEIYKALTAILPSVKDIYGSFWAELIELTQRSCSVSYVVGDSDIPFLYAGLRLLMAINGLSIQESNDDLQDAWTDAKVSFQDGLLKLLIQNKGISDELHQPRRILNEYLARILAKMPPNPSAETGNLYPVLASESAALQTAVYEVLHRSIPAAQEEISVDRALSKDFVPKLPEELLSLIVAAPAMDSLAHANFERNIPVSLRSYLLSWKLVFDHWTGSSYKVKADYVACLKEGTYLNSLLDFTFDVLINARPKPLDASKYDIESYTPGTEQSPEKETHWLLIHLYYLSLKNLPTLSKTWWRDSTSRQTMIAVEAWTEKYISPLIINSELHAVSAWAPSQSNVDQPLHIKVSPSTREITASIPIDDQLMSIALHLPLTYPLSRATVDSVHRVGVDERKWRSWLITTQGVINFSSYQNSDGGGGGGGNDLIDGLLAWRKNVTLTLKGQTECAICYSVVGADGQLPSKRCGTCRNLFHGGCLYRWFKSSNSSSCPLCRNAFNYG